MATTVNAYMLDVLVNAYMLELYLLKPVKYSMKYLNSIALISRPAHILIGLY
jgi:hypothetical protein